MEGHEKESRFIWQRSVVRETQRETERQRERGGIRKFLSPFPFPRFSGVSVSPGMTYQWLASNPHYL